MNGLETKYALYLEQNLAAGEILRWDFEPAKFRLAKRTWYTPDFRVIDAEGLLEYHEVKGIWEDAARIKCKIFAELHPMYKLVAVKRRLVRDGGGWEFEAFNA